MRYQLLFLLFFLLGLGKLCAQDSSRSNGVLQINLESGLLFIDDGFELIEGDHKVLQTIGFGISFGDRETGLILNLRYRTSSFNLDSVDFDPSIREAFEYKFQRRQFALGITLPVQLTQKMDLLIKANLTANDIIFDDTPDLFTIKIGQIYSIGINKWMSKNFDFHLDFGYDYTGRLDAPFLSNLSGTFVSLGLDFNFLPNER